jgi:hypothetical protein
MEQAVVSGAISIVRLFELKADFVGKVDVQVRETVDDLRSEI